MKTLHVTFFLFLTFFVQGLAQYPIVRNFSSSDYGSGKQNWDITQTRDGRMLFANNNGMLAFDGDKWFTHPVANYTNVRAVFADTARQRFYVGASDELGYFGRDAESAQFRYHSLLEKLPPRFRAFGEVWSIASFGKQTVFQTKNELFLLSPRDGFSVVSSPSRIEAAAVVGGRYLIATHDGLMTLEGTRLEPLAEAEALRGKGVKALLNLGGKLLAATDDDGLYLLDGGSLQPYAPELTPFLRQSGVFCATTNGRYVAIGTVRHGLVVRDIATGATLYANATTGLQNNTILSLRFDSFGNLWLGLDNGISYLLLNTPYRALLGTQDNIGTGYASLCVGSNLFLGTNQGLFTMPYPIAPLPRPVAPRAIAGIGGQVWSIRQIGGLVLCGADDGAYLLRGTSAVRIEGTGGTWDFRALASHPGYILACDYAGFYVLRTDASGNVRLHSRLRGFDLSSGGLEEDADGSIWVSHWQKGIYRLSLNDSLTALTEQAYFHAGNGLLMDTENLLCRVGGRLYVSSVDGFSRYDAAQGTLVHDSSIGHIFNTYGTALRLYESPAGDLWAYKGGFLALATPTGTAAFRTDTISFRPIAQRLQGSLGHISYLEDGRALFNADEGFYVAERGTRGEIPSGKVLIRRISATNHGDTVLYGALPHEGMPSVRVPHTLNSLRIEFVMPEYRQERGVTYSCYLENYDNIWGQEQTATTKEYTHLARGTYIFHVRAHNLVSGKTEETAIEIVILPAWWETWWAWLCYALLTFLLLRVVVRWLKRRAEGEFLRVSREKERQIKEQQAQLEAAETRREKEVIRLKAEQLEVELKHKTSQLADSTMNLIRRNEMFQQIDENMASLSESVRREDAKAEITAQIRRIRQDIQQGITADDNWTKFEENFNLVYDEYMKKLTARYPLLKMNDRKLCAYLRMGLNTKDIAALLNTSPRSVETARYRLRKKLELEQGENLADFLQNFG